MMVNIQFNSARIGVLSGTVEDVVGVVEDVVTNMLLMTRHIQM